MSDAARQPMTVGEFLAWAEEQGTGGHYELVAGQIVSMAPERFVHARLKGMIFRRLADAIEKAGLPCEAVVDGIGVQVGSDTIYIPDCLVRCGDVPDDEVMTVVDPVVIVEVLSSRTRGTDTGVKLVDYFRIPTLQHYLIVRAKPLAMIHHFRAEDGEIGTRIVRDGKLRLDPPGIDLDISESP
jgi:Uma2 family endonuclease